MRAIGRALLNWTRNICRLHFGTCRQARTPSRVINKARIQLAQTVKQPIELAPKIVIVEFPGVAPKMEMASQAHADVDYVQGTWCKFVVGKDGGKGCQSSETGSLAYKITKIDRFCVSKELQCGRNLEPVYARRAYQGFRRPGISVAGFANEFPDRAIMASAHVSETADFMTDDILQRAFVGKYLIGGQMVRELGKVEVVLGVAADLKPSSQLSDLT